MHIKRVLGVMFIVVLVVLAVLVPVVSATPADPALPPPTIPPPRIVKVRFMGTVAEILEGGIWILDTPGGPQEIVVNDGTRFVETLGEAKVGACVWVVAQVMPDGTLLALVITVREPDPERGKPLHFSGEIELLPGESVEGTWHEDVEGLWLVGEYEFLVTDRTVILPEGVEPAEGDWARVNAFRQPDGSLWAKKVTVLEAGTDEIAVTFTGIVQTYPSEPPYTGDWVISNITVTCAISTQVIGTPGVGLLAKVKAVLEPDGTLIATKIQIRNALPISVKFRGVIRSFAPAPSYQGPWKIGVVNVVADLNTVIDGTPEIGLMARVEGLPQTDGSVLATVITVEEEPPGPQWVEFTGRIERLPKHWQHGVWIVSEGDVQWHVNVSSRTYMTGPDPEVGANVHVRGTQTGGVVHASEIEVQ